VLVEVGFDGGFEFGDAVDTPRRMASSVISGKSTSGRIVERLGEAAAEIQTIGAKRWYDVRARWRLNRKIH